MEPTIVYEDEQVLAVNKLAGLVVHADGRTEEKTLCDWVVERYPGMQNVGEPLVLSSGARVARPGVVHRLDRETSGVLVLAKTPEAYAFLKKQFQERLVQKAYNAFVYGVLKEKNGQVDLPIGKSTQDFRLWSAAREARGTLREAHTAYAVLAEGRNASFLELNPTTGRTHQIRVHLKAIHHPVVCDKRYAPKRECILGFERLALHARRITLLAPSGVALTLEAPLPEDFLRAQKELAA